MNKLEVGKDVFKVEYSDGKAKPEFVFCRKVGVVKLINETIIEFGNLMQFPHSENMFLKPNSEGMAYYFAGFDEIEAYTYGDEGLYKIPTGVLKAYLRSYVSPWAK